MTTADLKRTPHGSCDRCGHLLAGHTALGCAYTTSTWGGGTTCSCPTPPADLNGPLLALRAAVAAVWTAWQTQDRADAAPEALGFAIVAAAMEADLYDPAMDYGLAGQAPS